MIPAMLMVNILYVPCPAFCEGRGRCEEGTGMTSSQQKDIEEVLARHTERLMAIPGVVGTALGICRNRPGIKVYVEGETPTLKAAIGDALEGIPVCLQPVGQVRALPDGEREGP
jgi:hypothetical protein